MQCPKCQTENPQGHKFCRECGCKMAYPCPGCSAEVLPGDKFCGNCGHDLRTRSASTAIDYEKPQAYTPKFLADKILKSRSAMEGERKLVTVLFADVANFTRLSEKLDPEEVHQIMDGCFRILIDEIHRYEGTINQFTGDGIMALFGAPVAHEDHAHRACRAALGIQKAMREYGKKIEKEYGVGFALRIGLNSGPVIVGAIGDDLRMDYTAVGDTTNLAARMEALARPATVLLSAPVSRLVKDYFALQPAGSLAVKGKQAPQEAFELIRIGDAATRIEAAVAKGLTEFVGREKNMAALVEAYETVKGGAGQVVGIMGEAGVGKSRLLFEFRNCLPQGECTYLEGRCVHFGSAMPYLPILDILRSYFDIRENEREVPLRKRIAETLRGLGPSFDTVLAPVCDLLSLKIEDEAYVRLDSRDRKEKVFETLRNLLSRISQEQPLVLAIEDLHWVDKTTEEFLDYFIRWMAPIKVLLVLLYRPEYTHPWGSKSYFNRIGVDQLSLDASAQLVAAILGDGQAAPELNEIILTRAAGNPLFMEELTHSFLENGTIRKQQGRYVLARKPSDLQVPDTVQGIIAARIDRLEENLKRVMQVAAVIGREFAFRILQTIVDVREGLKTHLLNLQGLEFIYEKSLFPELEYIFKHALTQEVAYNSLLTNKRKEIHKKIGSAIEELHADRLDEFSEVLAHHYTRAEDLEKAVFYLKRAGKKAVKSHALWEAIANYKQALDLLDALPESEVQKKETLEVVELIMTPFTILGFPEGAFPILRLGEQLSKDLKSERQILQFYSWVSAYYFFSGDHQMATTYVEGAFEEARKLQDIDWMAPLCFSLCNSYIGSGRYRRIVEIAPEVITLIEKTGRKFDSFGRTVNAYVMICGYCGHSMGITGNLSEGRVFIEKGLRHAYQLNDAVSLGTIELSTGMFFSHQGDWRAAKRHLEKAISAAEEGKFAFMSGMASSFLGLACAHSGDPESGREPAEKGLQIFKQNEIKGLLSAAYLFLGLVCLNLNEIEKAENLLKEALSLSRKNNEKTIEGLSLIYLGSVHGIRNTEPRETIERLFFDGLDVVDKLGLATQSAIGRIDLGEFYLSAGMNEKASESLSVAEKMILETGMDDYWVARICKTRAQILKHMGKRAQARENLEKAFLLFKECGCDQWANRCENELSDLV